MSRALSWTCLLALLGAWIACTSATAVVERRSVCNNHHHQSRPSSQSSAAAPFSAVQKKWGRPDGDKWSRGGSGSGPSRLNSDGAGAAQETGAARGGWGGWKHHHHRGDSASSDLSSGQPSSHSQVANSTPDQQESQIVSSTRFENTQQPASQTKQQSEASEPTSTAEQAVQSSNTASGNGDSSQPGLDRHNYWRAQYGADDLTWNADLASGSADWASQQCDGLHHAQSGENIGIGYGSADNTIDGWMDEVSKFDFSNPGYSDATGHFTQVIWKGSTEVGCGSFDCGDQMAWVCRYSPAGNVRGAFADNIGSKE